MIISGLWAAFNAASRLIGSSMSRATAMEVETRREQRVGEGERRRAATELAVQKRREQHALELEAVRAEHQEEYARRRHLFQHYPYDYGPGHLRESVPHGQLVVLYIPPSEDETRLTASPWKGLSRFIGDLNSYSRGESPFTVRQLRRNVAWPDRTLHRYDLFDVPTVTVRPAIDGER